MSVPIAQWLAYWNARRELCVLYTRVNRVHYVDRKHALIGGHYRLGRCLIYESLDLVPVEQHIFPMNGRLSLFIQISEYTGDELS